MVIVTFISTWNHLTKHNKSLSCEETPFSPLNASKEAHPRCAWPHRAWGSAACGLTTLKGSCLEWGNDGKRGVQLSSAPGSGRNQCGAGGAVSNTELIRKLCHCCNLHMAYIFAFYIHLIVFLWTYSLHWGIITILLNYSYSKS